MRKYTVVALMADAFGTPLPDIIVTAESAPEACWKAWDTLTREQQDYLKSIEVAQVQSCNI